MQSGFPYIFCIDEVDPAILFTDLHKAGAAILRHGKRMSVDALWVL